MKRTPWMPLYCDDLIGSTIDMSAEELGAYIRLLCHIWTRGPLPMDEKVICRIAGTKARVWKKIASRFSPCKRDDGTEGLSQTRLESERFRRWVKHEERSESGRKGASTRWKRGSADGSANGSAYSKPMTCHNHNHIRESSVVTTTTAREASPPPQAGGLPRMDVPDPATETAAANKAFIARHRLSKAVK